MKATITSYLPLGKNSDVSELSGDASLQKKGTGISEMLAAQSDDVNFIPGTHIVERED